MATLASRLQLRRPLHARTVGGVRLGTLAIGAAVVLAELILAAAVVQVRLQPILALLLAAAGLFLAFRFPFAVSCAFLATVASVFYNQEFVTSAGPIQLSSYELLLGALLIVAALRPRRHTLGGMPGIALAAFLGAIALAILLAVTAGRVGLTDSINWSRGFAMLTFFWVVVRLFPEPERFRRLLSAGCVVGALSGAIAALLAVKAIPASVFQDPTLQFVREQGSVYRVRLPGVALSYGLFWYALLAVIEARGGRRLFWSLTLGGMALGILISQNRNMWIGLVFGLALALAIGEARVRYRLVAGLAVLASVIGLVVISGADLADRAAKPLVTRGETLLDTKRLLREQSVLDRAVETKKAWATATEHPLTGIGPGASFNASYDQEQSAGRFIRIPQLFVHNQYLHLFLVGGILALGSFLWFLWAVMSVALRRPRDSLRTSLALGLATLAVSATVMLSFIDEPFTAVIALLAAGIFSEAVARGQEADVGASAPE